MPETFRRKDRLRKSKEFRRVYDAGPSFRRKFLVFWVAPHQEGSTRIGIVIRARYIKRSTRRVRIKRILREVFRKNRFRIKSGIDLIVGVRSDPGPSTTYALFEDLFLSLAKEARIIG